MKVCEIMTQPPQTCRLDTDLAAASRRMRETGCGVLMVIDRHGRLAGVLTDRDVAMTVANTRRNASHVTAQEAMTRRVHTCLPEDDLRLALNRMAAAKVRRLPVLIADGDLKGVISIDDIILWGVQDGGVTTSDLISALRSICAAHVPMFEPAVAEL